MVFGAIALVILLFAGWVLFVPVVFVIDTVQEVLMFRQLATIRFWFSDWQPRLRVLGFKIPLDGKAPAKRTSRINKPSEKKGYSVSADAITELVSNVAKSVTVKDLSLQMDTGDVIWNSKLVPLFVMGSRGPVRLSVNYQGVVMLRLRGHLHVYRIVWAMIRFIIKR